MKVRGLQTHRFKENPEEKRFAKAWDEMNEEEGRVAPTLDHLLDTDPNRGWGGHRPAKPSERDVVVAATVIQWLGSEIGQGFLRDLGYMKKEEWKRHQKEKRGVLGDDDD
jgi:hypothetical protein